MAANTDKRRAESRGTKGIPLLIASKDLGSFLRPLVCNLKSGIWDLRYDRGGAAFAT